MTVHIIGGGLSGLAAAVACAARGLSVHLYEAAPQLGGRARSYESTELGAVVDNGAHAVLGNNVSVQAYLRMIGAGHTLRNVSPAGLMFCDIIDRTSWRLKWPDALWSPQARPPQTDVLDFAVGLNLILCNPRHSAAAILRPEPIARRKFWEPLCTSALNTPLADANPLLLSRVLQGMISRGGLSKGLYLPQNSMAASYIAPAETFLAQHGASIHRRATLRDIAAAKGIVQELTFDSPIPIAAQDRVILAVPPWSGLLMQIGINTTAFTYTPIINAHFKPSQPWALPHGVSFLGLTGGQAQWAMARDGILSVTVSAAEELNGLPSAEIAARLWREIAPLLRLLPTEMPRFHVIKERRATLRHTPRLHGARPGPLTRHQNLFLAGDWTDTGLPCTLESAIQSGFAAAKLAF